MRRPSLFFLSVFLYYMKHTHLYLMMMELQVITVCIHYAKYPKKHTFHYEGEKTEKIMS